MGRGRVIKLFVLHRIRRDRGGVCMFFYLGVKCSSMCYLDIVYELLFRCWVFIDFSFCQF